GVEVEFVPHLEQFRSAADPTELRGGAAVTHENGQFVIGLPVRTPGEIRVRDPEGAAKRIPVAALEPGARLELGTIALTRQPTVAAPTLPRRGQSPTRTTGVSTRCSTTNQTCR